MIYVKEFCIPAASMGEENPIADIYCMTGEPREIENQYKVSKNLSEEEARYVGKGIVSSILPYTIQNNYDRNRKMHSFQAVILENEYLKAMFLPELGGRLWSLWDKENGKELLSANPVFQPANLAFRGAWFSGGVEFNVGVRGHNPLTCSPMFSRIAQTESGEEVLQMYEFERIRGVAYGINAYLPEGSRLLYLHNTIENKHDREIYMYWWTNIAVPETPKTRVVVPADQCFTYDYSTGQIVLDKVPIPMIHGVDNSYPTNIYHSQDYFYQIRQGADRFITAVDENAYGLVHISTNKLKSRKLFVWGQGAGGKNWQRFLSDGSGSYIEIQGGLANTQMEHIPMPANTTWEWTEAFGALLCEKNRIFSENWNTAVSEACSKVIKMLNGASAEAYLQHRVPEKFATYRAVSKGSGFGALEQLLTKRKISDYYDFGEKALGEAQRDWELLLRRGYLPEHTVCTAPASYVSGDRWQSVLQESLKMKESRHWYTYYQLGVTAFANGDSAAAAEAFRQSVACQPNPWSYCCLAMLKWRGDRDKMAACELFHKAVSFPCNCVNLYQQYAKCLLDAGRYETWVKIYEKLPKEIQKNSRLELVLIQCYLALGDYEKTAEMLNVNFVLPDIREGEISLSALWEKLYVAILKKQHPDLPDSEIKRLCSEKYPIPEELDFRQNSEF